MLSLKIENILEKSLKGKNLELHEALFLLQQTKPEITASIKETANFLRQQQVGNTVTYVVNCNINFTNICEQHCNFCAFRRDAHQEGAFWLTTEQILSKAKEALQKGATEICMQGGLNPEAKIGGSSLRYYLKLVETIKGSFPQLHLHAFSPQEIEFIATQDALSYEYVIVALKQQGVDSLPGTAAEVLDDKVRRIICPEKLDTATWLEIITTAHRLGVPTTSTMLSGHIETSEQQVKHLNFLRDLQQVAIKHNYPARFTEFIVLPFVGEQAPKALRNRVGRDQPLLEPTLLLTAVARIFLGGYIVHHQPSWVKLGIEGATEALNWGCDDLGGTLMEEHITTMAGAKGGTAMTVEGLQQAISSINRPYAQRTTLYRNAASGY